MGKYAHIDAIFADIEKKNRSFERSLIDALNSRTNHAFTLARADFGEYQQEKIREIFNDAVTSFYEAYDPIEYDDRNGDTSSMSGGLYEVLDMKIDEYGWVITKEPNYEDLFNKENMHPDRQGKDTLYDKVFISGYHGGSMGIDASKTAMWGVHPSPGVPYYRTSGWVKYPGQDKKKWHRYAKWGYKAVMTASPYKIINKELPRSEQKEMIPTLLSFVRTRNDDAVNKFMNDDVKRIQKEIYG